MDSPPARLSIPGDLRYLEPLVSYAAAVSSLLGFSPEEVEEIRLAVEEAASNAIRHGLEGDATSTLELEILRTAGGAAFTFREKGLPFDPERAPQFDPERLRTEGDARGLGLFLLRRTMDEVRFENLGREGKALHLVKRLRGGRAAAEQGAEGPPAVEGIPPAGEPPPYEVRPMRPGEGLEVSRCAYRCYGYTYEDYIYHPEAVEEANRTGTLVSVVAAAPSGEILGHIALKFSRPGAPIAECGLAFVKPAYRRTGVFKALNEVILGRGREMGLRGVTIRAVTGHDASQRAAAHFGYVECGILLGVFPSDVDFKALTGRVHQKESAVLAYLPFVREAPGPLYAGPSHGPWVERIFAALEIPARLAEPGAEPRLRGQETTLRSAWVPVLNVAEIEVTSYGTDPVGAVRAGMEPLLEQGSDAVYLTLDLEDPETGTFLPAFESAGFLFAGILPHGASGKTALVLQYLNHLRLDLGAIHPAGRLAQDLLAHIAASKARAHP